MFEFDDVELSGPLPLLLSSTLVPGTVLSVVDAAATPPPPSTKTARKAAPTANRTRISTPRPCSARTDGRDTRPLSGPGTLMPVRSRRETTKLARQGYGRGYDSPR